MEKDLENPSCCKPQGDDNNRVTNRGDPNNSKVITNHIIVDNTKSTTNYANVVTNNVDPDNEVITNLSITANFDYGVSIVSTSIVNVGLNCSAVIHMVKSGSNLDINLAGVPVNLARFPGVALRS